MNPIQAPDFSRSHLFLVRVWPEQGSEGQVEWRGRLQDVVSGEAHTFQGCPELVDVLVAMLPAIGKVSLETQAAEKVKSRRSK